jgi:hypothetical protein
VPSGVLDLAVATLDGEVVRVAPARRALCVPVRSQQFHAYVLPREVVRGVVGDLPNELEALRVGDELSAEVRSHPFGPVLDMNTLSGLRHRTLPRSMDLVGNRWASRFRDNQASWLAPPLRSAKSRTPKPLQNLRVAVPSWQRKRCGRLLFPYLLAA